MIDGSVDELVTFGDILTELEDPQARALGLWDQHPHRYKFELDDSLKRLIEAVRHGTPPAVSTGFVEIDELLGGGYRPGELHIVAARTAMGKTAFMLSQLLHMSRHHKTAYISLEMPRVLLAQRLVMQLSGVKISRLRWSVDREWERPDAGEYDQIVEAIKELRERQIELIDESAEFSTICGQIRALADAGCEAVVIDGLWLMRSDGAQDLRIELKRMTGQLKEISISHNISIIGVHQINRGVEGRQDRRPGVADLRDSSIEDDADSVTALYRPVMYLKHDCPESERDSAEAIILKNRNGPTGTANLKFLGERMQWANR